MPSNIAIFILTRINFNQKAITVSRLHGAASGWEFGYPFPSHSWGPPIPSSMPRRSLNPFLKPFARRRIDIVTRPLSHLEMGSFLGGFLGMKLPARKTNPLNQSGSRTRAKRFRLPIPFRGVPLSLLVSLSSYFWDKFDHF